MRSPPFVSGTTVWAATLCSGVEISPFGDARDPRAGDAYPQRLPPRRTPGASQLGLPRFALTRPAAQLRPGPQLRPRAPQLRSGLKLSLDPARKFGPVGNMRRAVHPPGLATAIYRLDAFPSCLPWQDIVLMRSRRGLDEKKASSWQHIACMHSNTANFGKICVPCIQKAPQSAAGEYAVRKSCHQGAFSPSEALKSCMARKSCHPLMNLALAQG